MKACKSVLSSHQFKTLTLRNWREEEYPLFMELLNQHHYLGSPDRKQILLAQCVLYENEVVALLTWTHPALALQGRDRYIGWDNRTRSRRIGLVIQNNRFLLLTPRGSSNLSSHILGRVAKEVPEAWEQKFGKRPLYAETFVNPEAFNGTSYKASGWINVGKTAGFSRYGSDFFTEHGKPKDLWLKELSKDARNQLKDPSIKIKGEKRRAPGKMPVNYQQAGSLKEAFRKVEDPRTRRGRQYPLTSMLATATLAICSGATTVTDIFEFCQDLSTPQRRALGYRQNPKAPKVVPPPGESCWRSVLSRVDPDQLSSALNQWLLNQSELPELLSIDGKVVGNNLASIVSLVDAKTGAPVAQQAASGNGKEQRLAQKLIDEIPASKLTGKTIAGDALYSQKKLTKTINHKKGAYTLTQLKENQKTTDKIIRRDFELEAPPF